MGERYPDDWASRSRRIKEFDDWKCQVCDRKGGNSGDAELHAHHIVPKSQGGGHGFDNLTTLCDRCHAAFHNDPRLISESNSGGAPIWLHLLILFFTFWTFGVANLLLEFFWRRKPHGHWTEQKKRRKGVKKLRKRAGKDPIPANRRGFWEDQVDDRYNSKFGGCPSCGRSQLTVYWKSRRSGKIKVIECMGCDAEFKEQTIEGQAELQQVDDSSEIESIDSALEYELEKQMATGEIDQSQLGEVKQELLKEVQTEQEKELIREKFKKYE